MSRTRKIFFLPQNKIVGLNMWDFILLIVFFCVFVLLAWGARQMAMPYKLGQTLQISLSPKVLPYYALQTVLRMFIALFFSLLCTFIFGTWAAKSKQAEKIIIPAIDILQSVPILGFLSITIVIFIAMFPGNLLGPTCAAVFVIFTSQAWNMILGFYQTLKTVPADLVEAADVFQLSPWQKFWRVEVPFSMPGLLWNMMLSMSASWFFVVASEAITVSGQDISLPGIGSYIAVAIGHANMTAVTYSIITMLIVILLYDQLLFRPLVKWAEKFRLEETGDEKESSSWLIEFFQRTRIAKYFGDLMFIFSDKVINAKYFRRKKQKKSAGFLTKQSKKITLSWNVFLAAAIIFSLIILCHFIFATVSFHEVGRVFVLGVYTLIRVVVLIILCSLVWVPVGVWIGRRPKVAQVVQPIAQFLAAFPANLLFPVVVVAIVTFHLNVQIWTTPLMILGTQWYILFNVIAGSMTIPKELYLAADNFGVKGWLWWRRVALPGVFPYYITGAITAAGGAWNASIVAEVVSWGHTTLRATGLGAYIAEVTTSGNFHKIALGISVMCIFVLVLNKFVWRPLYRMGETRYRLD